MLKTLHLKRLTRIRFVIDTHVRPPQTHRVTILVMCADDERMQRLKDAIHAAGFNLILAKAIDEAWMKTDYVDFSAVVIDHTLSNDIAASAFGQRFITLTMREETQPEEVALD